MSLKGVARLEQDAKTNEELPAKLAEAAPGLGCDLSEDDIMQHIKEAKQALSEKELDKVAGCKKGCYPAGRAKDPVPVFGRHLQPFA